jgi:hypothetical protein
MDDNDKNDIIKKVNTAGNNDSKEPDMGDNNNNNDNGNDNEGGSNDNNDLSFDSIMKKFEEYKVYESDDLFLDKPKKNNMFQPNSNDILDSTEPTIKETIKNLFNSKKNSMFDRKIMSKLQETFRNYVRTNSRTKKKPVTAPTVKPSRRNNPFTIEPDTMPQVPPKASDDSFNNIV